MYYAELCRMREGRRLGGPGKIVEVDESLFCNDAQEERKFP